MPDQFFNKSHLTQHDDNKQSVDNIFSDLNNLVKKIIFPETENLISFLCSEIDDFLDKISEDQDIVRWNDTKNHLRKSESLIKKQFLENLVTINEQIRGSEKDSLTLELMDNDELDHNLLWMSATNHFYNKDNSEDIYCTNLILKTIFPDYEGSYPATPERLCESFSISITNLNLDHDIEQKLFLWFTNYFNKITDLLWLEANQLLTYKGLNDDRTLTVKTAVKSNLNPSDSPKTNSCTVLPDVNRQDSAINSHMDIENPQFLESFANNLVSKLECSLAEHNLIPMTSEASITDLTNVLDSIQLEILDKKTSPKNLQASLIDGLNAMGLNSELSRHHEDMISMVGWLFEYIFGRSSPT